MVGAKWEIVRISEDEIAKHSLGEYRGVWLVRQNDEPKADDPPLIRANMLRANNGQYSPPVRLSNTRLLVSVDEPNDAATQNRIAKQFADEWGKIGGRSVRTT